MRVCGTAGISPSPHHSVDYRLGLLRAFAYKLFLSALYARGLLAPNLVTAVQDSLGAADDRPVTQVCRGGYVQIFMFIFICTCMETF